MPQIIPIKDLKNTNEVSEMCKAFHEPIFITKNGYGAMVIMGMETYEKSLFMNDVYQKTAKAEESIRQGKVKNGFDSLRLIREKHGL